MKAKTRAELLTLYDEVGEFTSEGLAWARKDGQEFHIRLDGTPLYPERYDIVRPFFQGLAGVCKDRSEWKWSRVDTSGKVVQPFYNDQRS